MKRFLKNSIYVAAISTILFFAVNSYDSSAKSEAKTSFYDALISQTVYERLPGEPPEKLALLVAILHAKYPEASIIGQYGYRPLLSSDLQVNYVIYYVTLNFPPKRTVEDFDKFDEKRNQILGELALSTAKLLGVETHIPYVETNILHEMKIDVDEKSRDVFDVNRAENKKELQQGSEIFIPQEYQLQSTPNFKTFLFDDIGMKGLFKENNPLNWHEYKYGAVLDYGHSLPNTGPTENAQPPIE